MPIEPHHSRAHDSLQKLESWIDKNGWAGWDPYDIKGHKSIIKLAGHATKNQLAVYVRELVYELLYQFPLSSRKILGIEQKINPKGMALFASAYLILYNSTGNDRYFEKALFCMDWLIKNPCESNTGLAWGYPFDWQSTILIPANTPNGIVTTAVGTACWEFYQMTGEGKYLNRCIEICTFLSSLPKDQFDKNKICFAYTPLFQNHVHNLNLFIAEYLIKVGMEIDATEWIRLGNAAVNYTLGDQAENGTFDYNGPPEKPQKFIDNYHTGFVLRMLHSIWKLTAHQDVFDAMDRCYDHYIKHFFEDQQVPKLLPDRKYRIDIHSCAEAIHCISLLSETYPQHLFLGGNVLKWTLENLQDKMGYFYYGILKSRITGIPYISKIPYIRWGQAWMLKSLAVYADKTKILNES